MTLFFLPLLLNKKPSAIREIIVAIGIFILMVGKGTFAQSFHEGVRAFEQHDYEKAYSLFTQLANQGHVDALNNLGTFYQTGKGVEKNYPKATEVYKKAAIFGHINAAYNLANLTRLGIGVPQNMPEAYAWSIVAARHGASDLIAFRDALAKDLSDYQRRQATELALKVLKPIAEEEIAQAWLIPNELEGLLFNKPFSSTPPQQGQLFTNAHAIDYSLDFPLNPPTKKTLFTPSKQQINRSSNLTASQVEGVSIPQGFSLLSKDKTVYLDDHHDEATPFVSQKTADSALPPSLEEQLSSGTMPLTPQVIDGVLIPEGFSLLQKKNLKTQPNLSPVPYISQKEPASLENEQYNQTKTPTHFGYSSTLGHSTTTIFRAQKEELLYYPNATVLRPRRIIPIKSSPLYLKKSLDSALHQVVDNLTRTMNTPFDGTLEALILMNPHKIEETKEGILKEINLEQPLYIPSQEFIYNLLQNSSKDEELPNHDRMGWRDADNHETPKPKKE